MLASSSPWGAVDHWFRTLWSRGLDAPDAMYESFHWPSTVSPLVDQTLVDHWRDTWPEAEFRREVLAEWTDDVGAYFTEQELTDGVGDWEMVPPAGGGQLGIVVGGVGGAIRLMRTRWRWLRFLSLTTGAVCGFGCRGCRRSSVSRTRLDSMILLG